MLKTTLGAVLFLCALLFLSAAQAHAAPLNQSKLASSDVFKIGSLNPPPKAKKISVSPAHKKPVNKPVHKVAPRLTIKKGQTLSSVAQKYHSTWRRLFDKNPQIKTPDILKIGQKVTIPLKSEKLPRRPLPSAPASAPLSPAPPSSKSTQTTIPANSGPATSSGNTYYPGYCTWYAKSRRPDLPNNLGNADTWVARASAQGFATGSAPRAGAIGQQGMHVVYVESVNSDGTVTISEMNYQGFNVVSSRTVAAGTFMYIY